MCPPNKLKFMPIPVHLDIVSLEAQIFSGMAEMVTVTGEWGELGILYRHAPLLTNIKPGQIKVKMPGNKEEVYYVSGGILEVQPNRVTVLADTVVRAANLDEATALEAKKRAENMLTNAKAGMDISNVLIQLSQAAAQLRAIKMARKG